MPCTDFYELFDSREAIRELASEALFRKTKLTIRAKIDGYKSSEAFLKASVDDKPFIRYNVVRAQPFSLKEENQDLLMRLSIYKTK